jgi:putative tRNA adenosine deaminase-associated protein
MAHSGYAIAAFREGGEWRCEPLPPSVLDDLGVLLQALRSQPPEGGPFVVATVEDEFFVLARQDGAHINLMLSDLTAAVDFPLAAQVLERLGEDPPDDDELDEIWPLGDLDLLDDLGLSEDEMEAIVDDLDSFPDEMLDTIANRIGVEDVFDGAVKVARNVR